MVAKRKAAVAAILFTALVLLSVNIGWWWYYQSMTAYLEQQLSARLTGTAASAALHVSPDRVDNLLIDNLDAYAGTLEFIDSLALINALSEVAVIDIDFNYIVTTREEIPEEGYLLARLNLDSLQQAVRGRAVASQLYDVDGVYLKSAYAPLIDTQNEVAAILVVEAGAGYFDLLSALRRNLYFLAGGSVGAVLLLLVAYIIYSRRMAEAEERLFRAGSQAALGRMVAIVSHEIKNPLMILRAAGERIEKKYNDPEASFITEEVSRLDTIVSGYLSFARGESSIHKDTIDLSELSAKILDQLAPQFAEQAVRLDREIEREGIIARVDRVGIRQIIINLLLNGLHAAADNPGNNRVIFSLTAQPGRIIIAVSDTGPGIKPAHREKLFEPFFTTKTQGSGLGLYLCRKLVEQHNGTIAISEIRPGMTSFVVSLPSGEKQ